MKTVYAGLMWLALGAVSAMGFPTWGGVYGDYERHDAENLGSFTILLNQDYQGLHAEVGIQVDGGEWAVFPMSYSGSVSGNSVWTYTPAASYSAGAEVVYYFHYFDDWGGHAWDSNSGDNYSFTASGGGSSGPSSLIWEDEQALDELAGSSQSSVAVYNGVLHAAYTSNTRVYYVSKAQGTSWTAPVEIGAGPSADIAAGLEGLFVATGNEIYRSPDEGSSWAFLTPSSRQGDLQVENGMLYQIRRESAGGGNPSALNSFYLEALDLSSLVWAPPVQAASGSCYLCGFGANEFQVEGSKMLIRIHEGRWGSDDLVESSDGGQTWNQTLSNALGVRADLSQGVVRYTSTMGGPGGIEFNSGAQTQVLWGSGLNNRGLVSVGSLLVSLVSDNGGGSFYRTSQDGGATWGSATPGGLPGFGQMVADETSAHVFLSNYGDNTVTFRSRSAYGGAVSYPELASFGGNYHWPFNGDIEPGDAVWFNLDTYPKGAAMAVKLHFSTDGGAWQQVSLNVSTVEHEGDHWYTSLVGLPGGSSVQYAYEVVDHTGSSSWDNNGGGDYIATVNGAPSAEVSLASAGFNIRTVGSGGSCGFGEGDVTINIAAHDLGPDREVGVVWTRVGSGEWNFDTATQGADLPSGLLGYSVFLQNAGSVSCCPSGCSGFGMQYAIYYTVNGVTYWDNNDGNDHLLTVNID